MIPATSPGRLGLRPPVLVFATVATTRRRRRAMIAVVKNNFDLLNFPIVLLFSCTWHSSLSGLTGSAGL